jgi:transcriptional regulator with XRE-family HTH domain
MATEDICVVLGRRVKRLRKRRGWKQADLAAHSGLGRVFLSNLERGKHNPKLKTLQILAGSFDLTISQLLRGV